MEAPQVHPNDTFSTNLLLFILERGGEGEGNRNTIDDILLGLRFLYFGYAWIVNAHCCVQLASRSVPRCLGSCMTCFKPAF